MKPTQRKINSEIGKMLRSYELLIANPLREVEKWRKYGEFSACRMCNLMMGGRVDTDWNYEYTGATIVECRACPIANNGGIVSCTAYNNTSLHLECAIDEILYFDTPTKKEIQNLKAAAKKRYKYLLKLLNVNGYQYK